MQGKTGGDASGRVTDGQKNSAFNMELRALFPFYMGSFVGENIADGLAGADIRGGVGHGRVSGVIAAEDVATVFKGNALDDVLVIGEAREANQRDLTGFGRGINRSDNNISTVDAGFHAVAAGADDAEAGGIGVFAGNVGRFVRVSNGVEGQARSGGTENVNGFRGGLGIRRGDFAALERVHHLAKGLPCTIIKASKGTENGLCEVVGALHDTVYHVIGGFGGFHGAIPLHQPFIFDMQLMANSAHDCILRNADSTQPLTD